MTAPLSRYFEKADVSILTAPPQNHGSGPALGILVGSTRGSCQVPNGNLDARFIGSQARPARSPSGKGARRVVALAFVLAIAVFFLSAAAVCFLRGQASPSSSVAPAEIQSVSQTAPVLERAIDWAKDLIVATLPPDEDPPQESTVEAPAADPPETKELPKPLVFERLGTSVHFLRDPDEAAREAGKQGKLLFVLHVSGDFEDAALTWNNAQALRVNALASPDVGDFLNNHFVATYERVATFKIVNGAKQGGNVASYFCERLLDRLQADAVDI